MPGRTDNEIKNYWNTRIKRRQRAGLPIYPPEIQQHQAAAAKADRFNDIQKQIRPNNCVSHGFPAPRALFNAMGAGDNYLMGNFGRIPQLQPPVFPVKMELPLAQVCPGYFDCQKMAAPPPAMGQRSNGLFEGHFQDPQGTGELFDEGLLVNPLLAGCPAIAEPLPQPLPLPSNLCKPENSDFFPLGAMNQPVMANHDGSHLLEMNPAPTAAMPPEKLISNWCDWDQSQDNDLRVVMERLTSDLFMPHDRNFGSSSCDNRN